MRGENGDVSRPTVVEIKEVTKAYRNQAKSQSVLEATTLAVNVGEFVSILGPSGSGKTTLLRMVGGLTEPTSGSIELRPTQEKSATLAFVFQDINLLPWRNTLQNVEFGLEGKIRDKASRKRQAMQALEMVGLPAVSKLPPYRLSGGMQQRVGLARALAVQPDLLLMDEPFGQLDAFTRETLQIQVAQLWASLEMAVMFVTHDIDEAIFLSTRIVVLSSMPGRVIDDVEVPLGERRWERNLRDDPRATNLYNHLKDLITRDRPASRGRIITRQERQSEETSLGVLPIVENRGR